MASYKRRYKNQTEQNAYENACDCHYYGVSSREWNDCGITQAKRATIWHKAWEDVANNDFLN